MKKSKRIEKKQYNRLMRKCKLLRKRGMVVPKDSFGDIDDNKLFLSLCSRSLKRLTAEADKPEEVV
jgi:hypothetical protein